MKTIKQGYSLNDECGSEKRQEPSFFNCHVHLFNFDHVNPAFLKGIVPLWVGAFFCVLTFALVWGIYYVVRSNLVAPFPRVLLSWFFLFTLFALLVLSFLVVFLWLRPINLHNLLKRRRVRRITRFLERIIPGEFDSFVRYANFIKHAYHTMEGRSKTQKEVLGDLQSYYPRKTRFVALSMDMDYMVDNKNNFQNSTFYNQLKDLRELKKESDFKDILFPFIHADPRRLSSDKSFFGYLKEGIETGVFSGIKLYPALGYFPFDLRLKPVYDLAVKFNIPITVHCSIGPVYYRGKVSSLRKNGFLGLDDGVFRHPITGNKLFGKSSRAFTPHFTHPLNYFFLMNCASKLADYWRKCKESSVFDLHGLPIGKIEEEGLKNYRNLKICLGHFGGSLEWRRYLDNAWFARERVNLLDFQDMENLIHEKNGMWKYQPNEEYIDRSRGGKGILPINWFSIISELLKLKDKDGLDLFPNLYSDISYNLSDERILPLLKVRLDTDDQIGRKILFGSDFYMVAMQSTERRATINLRWFIGENNFRKIAVENPKAFLSSSKTLLY